MSASASATPSHVYVNLLHNGLRLHDNPALHSISTSPSSSSSTLIPLYIIDSVAPFCQSRLQGSKVNKSRAKFMIESLNDFDSSLKSVGSGLVCLQTKDWTTDARISAAVTAAATSSDSDSESESDGDSLLLPPFTPSDYAYALTLHSFLSTLPSTSQVTIVYERETSLPSLRRWRCCLELAVDGKDNVNATVLQTNTLHPLDTYLQKCGGKIPSSYGSFTKIFNNLPGPDPCLPNVTRLPGLPEGLGGKLEVPALGVLSGVDLSTGGSGAWSGGEASALSRLNATIVQKYQWAASFEKPKTSPNSLEPSTTLLSPYVKAGCLSPRLFYHKLTEAYEKNKDNSKSKNSAPPVSLHGQLMWREYNYLHAYSTPNFDRILGNPTARQIPWDDDPVLLKKWKDGATGYPFIDAIMAQLKETGWIHHLARHMVACFLTRGDCWQSWERGAAVFEERLVDADWSINNFNWQWLSCTAHFYQYFRCYSPVAFGKKTDPNGDYIRKWVPALKNMPKKYIYQPWEAPLSVQEAAGCMVGKDYPERIIEDHTSTSKANMGRMAEAYKLHKEREAEEKKKAGKRKRS